MILLEALNRLLKDLITHKFWGKIELTIEGGKIVHCKKIEGFTELK